jgi:hypothetical protein
MVFCFASRNKSVVDPQYMYRIVQEIAHNGLGYLMMMRCPAA